MSYSFRRIRYLLFSHNLYGSHSGYTMVQPAVEAQFPHVQKIELRSLRQRFMQKLVFLFGASGAKKSKYRYSERVFVDGGQIDRHTIYHALNFNTNPGVWRRFPGQKNLIGTLHYFNPERLSAEVLADLGHLTSAITLAERHVPIYEDILGAGRVKFVHHGVDTNFFRPSGRRPRSRRLLFVGRVARDFAMLRDVLTALVPRDPKLRYDLVLTEDVVESEIGDQLKAIPGVYIYSRISDDHLRQLYQLAYLLLLPLHEAGANNSIVEALAAGLPIVTTDASGVYSYGGDSVYPLVQKGDVEGMVALVEKYLSDTDLHAQAGVESRRFAEQFLRWDISARAHLRAYELLYR